MTRQIDQRLKRIDVSGVTSIEGLKTTYADETGSLDVNALATLAECRIDSAIESNDLPALLGFYDNKGLLALAAQHLKDTDLKPFKVWLDRILRKGSAPALTTAIRRALPDLP